MRYRVVRVTNNPLAYPEYEEASEAFPYLVDEIEDENAVFVVNEDGVFWHANEFFSQMGKYVTEFYTKDEDED